MMRFCSGIFALQSLILALWLVGIVGCSSSSEKGSGAASSASSEVNAGTGKTDSVSGTETEKCSGNGSGNGSERAGDSGSSEPLLVQVPAEGDALVDGEHDSTSGSVGDLEEVIEKDFRSALEKAQAMEKTDPEGASRAYQVLSADYPNRYEPYHRLALLMEAAGDEDAIAIYEEALRMNPTEAAFFNDFGWYLYTIRNFDRSVIMLQRACSLDPQSKKYVMNLALATAQTGRWDEAFAILQKFPGQRAAESYYLVSIVQLEQALQENCSGNKAEGERKFRLAKESIQKALALEPDYEEAVKMKENFELIEKEQFPDLSQEP